MNMAFFDPLDNFSVVYLDDLLIFGKIIKEHKKALDTMFARLANH